MARIEGLVCGLQIDYHLLLECETEGWPSFFIDQAILYLVRTPNQQQPSDNMMTIPNIFFGHGFWNMLALFSWHRLWHVVRQMFWRLLTNILIFILTHSDIDPAINSGISSGKCHVTYIRASNMTFILTCARPNFMWHRFSSEYHLWHLFWHRFRPSWHILSDEVRWDTQKLLTPVCLKIGWVKKTVVWEPHFPEHGVWYARHFKHTHPVLTRF